MRNADELGQIAAREIDTEKDAIGKEVMKEILLEIAEADRAVGEAAKRLDEANRIYKEVVSNESLFMKLCLKKATSSPVTKD